LQTAVGANASTVSPTRCAGVGEGCNSTGCPADIGVVENIPANNHLQPWMVDKTLPAQLATYSMSWSVIITRLQHNFSDTTEEVSSRRSLLLPDIAHLEFGFPEYKQSLVIQTKYSAKKGGWVLRLIRGLKGDTSEGNILVFMPHSWSLHREEPQEHLADGKIADMPTVLDFPINVNVEAQAAARMAKAKAAAALAKGQTASGASAAIDPKLK
jgi:hypothetical protein